MFTKGKLEVRWWRTLSGLPAHRSRCASLFVSCSSLCKMAFSLPLMIRFSHRTPHTTPRRQLWWSGAIQGWEQVGISSTWAKKRSDGWSLSFLPSRVMQSPERTVCLEITLRRWSWMWNFKSGPAFGPAYRTFWSHLVYQTRLPVLVVRLSFDFLLCLARPCTLLWIHVEALAACLLITPQFLSASCLWGW